MHYVIAASPVAKIFQRGFVPGMKPEEENRWFRVLKRDPMRIFKEEPFEVIVQRPSGTIRLDYGKPKQIFGKEESEAKLIVEWLTGGPNGDRCLETDCYGIVPFEVGVDVLSMVTGMGELQAMAAEGGEKAERAERRRLQLNDLVQPKIMKAQEDAKKLAHERVMRQVRTIYRNLMDQYEKNRQQGVGLYTPSPVEYLCAYVLRDEIRKAEEAERELNTQFQEIMRDVKVVK